MSEKEKKIIEKICVAIPNMDDFDRGYFLGKAEEIAKYSEKSKKKQSVDTDREVS